MELEKRDMVTFEAVKKNAEIRTYIEKGNANLGVLGFTKHSNGHATKVSDTAAKILEELEYPARTVELARIAGYMHDIGNCVNRTDHAHNGAIMAMMILRDMGMKPDEIATVIAAIGNHDEKTGTAVDAVSAALILADKTDVRRNRVRNTIKESFDKHDRVNYAAVASSLHVNVEKQVILLRYALADGVQRPQHEVGKILGISRSYVSRIEKQALEKIRRAMEEEAGNGPGNVVK